MNYTIAFRFFILTSLWIFPARLHAQATLIIDCPDSLDFAQYEYTLVVKKGIREPLSNYETRTWLVSENNQRFEFMLSENDLSPSGNVRVALISTPLSDDPFADKIRIMDEFTFTDRLTHLKIPNRDKDSYNKGVIKKLPSELVFQEMTDLKVLQINVSKLYEEEDHDHFLDVSFPTGSPVTYTDYETTRNIQERDHTETYRVIRTPDSLVQVKLRIWHKTKYRRLNPIDTLIRLHRDTTIFNLRIDSLELKEEFKQKRKDSRVKSRRYVSNNLKDLFQDWESIVAYTSYYQGHRPFGEVLFGTGRYGLFRRLLQRSGGQPGHIYGPAIGTEFNFSWRENDFILGPKIGFQASSLLANAGLHFVYYTDFNQGVLYVKPRVGINLLCPFLNLSYSYAIRLGPNYFGTRVNQHQFCLNAILPIRLWEYD